MKLKPLVLLFAIGCADVPGKPGKPWVFPMHDGGAGQSGSGGAGSAGMAGRAGSSGAAGSLAGGGQGGDAGQAGAPDAGTGGGPMDAGLEAGPQDAAPDGPTTGMWATCHFWDDCSGYPVPTGPSGKLGPTCAIPLGASEGFCTFDCDTTTISGTSSAGEPACVDYPIYGYCALTQNGGSLRACFH